MSGFAGSGVGVAGAFAPVYFVGPDSTRFIFEALANYGVIVSSEVILLIIHHYIKYREKKRQIKNVLLGRFCSGKVKGF